MVDFDTSDGATPIDPEEAEGLVFTHITTKGELNRWERDNIAEAMAWLDRTRPKDILDEWFIRRLHKKMFGNVWKWAGRFRLSNKNIGVPWAQIPTDTKNLCDSAQAWIEFKTYPDDEIAVRFHHRLVFIHPFPNGNGRHARLMADLLIQNVLHGKPFSWGAADLVKEGESRKRYISALQAADNFDYGPLLEFSRS